MECCALIMAGGHGTRFWPWSGDLLPKQFLPISHADKSLLRLTYERIAPLTEAGRILVLTNREYVSLVRMHLPELEPSNIIGEPLLRDTAAAIGLGSAIAAKRWKDAVQIVLPADHEISPDERFREILDYAAHCSEKDGKLYTIGIRPTRPSSAYGYLHLSGKLDSPDGMERSELAGFVEKPDSETAAGYLKSGEYEWNAGMFIWRPDALADAMARRLPEHAKYIPEAVEHIADENYESLLSESFLKLPKISIDFGLMQSEGAAGNVRVVRGDFSWSDLGGWQSFSETLKEDANGNRVFGHAFNREDESWRESWHPRPERARDKDENLSLGEVYTMEANNNLVFNNRRGHKLVLYGVQDLAVVHTHQATLIVPKSLAEEIKPLVAALPKQEYEGGLIETSKVEKPWGWELWWAWTDDFAGKTLFLKKGKRFSLQYHVVKEEVIFVHQGRVRLETAVRGGEIESHELRAGQAVHVEPGRLHRIEALEDSLLLESSLPFLWDVVRVADDFGREGTSEAEAKPEKN